MTKYIERVCQNPLAEKAPFSLKDLKYLSDAKKELELLVNEIRHEIEEPLRRKYLEAAMTGINAKFDMARFDELLAELELQTDEKLMEQTENAYIDGVLIWKPDTRNDLAKKYLIDLGKRYTRYGSDLQLALVSGELMWQISKSKLNRDFINSYLRCLFYSTFSTDGLKRCAKILKQYEKKGVVYKDFWVPEKKKNV
jgi:hypothetical protein